MVLWGAGRTCLKGPNGKFVDIHENKFLCDSIYTGVCFIFTETTLKMDGGKYLSDVIEANAIIASDTPTRLDMKWTSFESFNVNTSLSVPAITYDGDVPIELPTMFSIERKRNYLVLKNTNATVDITFSIPYTMDEDRNGTVELILNHRRDAGGIIDVNLNNKPLIPKYSGTPTETFETQNLRYSTLASLHEENKLSINLSLGYPGNYYFSDAALVFKDSSGCVKQENSIYALGLSSSSSYNGGTLEEKLGKGYPYLYIGGLS